MREYKTSDGSKCRGKKLFTSFDVAERTAKASRKRREDEHYQPYHCIPCQGFHVGARLGKVIGKKAEIDG